MSTQLPIVAVIGTCDTKLKALNFLKQTIKATRSCDAILIDIGSFDAGPSDAIDISRSQVLDALTPDERNHSPESSSRTSAFAQMTPALARTLSRLYQAGSISGVIAAGGSGNTSVCTDAFRAASFPIGFPKLMVSTMASGDVACYVQETDITMMHSVVDVAGMDGILAMVLRNAAHAIAGMVVGAQASQTVMEPTRPAIAVTMFGVTTPCVQFVEKRLTGLGYDVVTFHATGAGGKAMERLISEGRFAGVMDLTTTELADELVGGVLSAGPNRLEAAAKARIPQVVSVGALDMVNFGPSLTVPSRFTNRLLFQHNASVTLMRTNEEECQQLGRILAGKVNEAEETKAAVVLPLQGMSSLSEDGQPFFDKRADMVLLDEIRGLSKCNLVEVDCSINDEKFADAAVAALMTMMEVG